MQQIEKSPKKVPQFVISGACVGILTALRNACVEFVNPIYWLLSNGPLNYMYVNETNQITQPKLLISG